MSRGSHDKPFYVDIRTSIVAIRCASNNDVVEQMDHGWNKGAIPYIENICDRINKEAELFYSTKEGGAK